MGFSSIQSLSRVRLFAIPMFTAQTKQTNKMSSLMELPV